MVARCRTPTWTSGHQYQNGQPRRRPVRKVRGAASVVSVSPQDFHAGRHDRKQHQLILPREREPDGAKCAVGAHHVSAGGLRAQNLFKRPSTRSGPTNPACQLASKPAQKAGPAFPFGPACFAAAGPRFAFSLLCLRARRSQHSPPWHLGSLLFELL